MSETLEARLADLTLSFILLALILPVVSLVFIGFCPEFLFALPWIERILCLGVLSCYLGTIAAEDWEYSAKYYWLFRRQEGSVAH